jgi:Ni,Fe-hydrogenase III large subunit/Ni,Fe-hydrogenase III component G
MYREMIEHDLVLLPANVPAGGICVDRKQWRESAQQLRPAGAELLTLWATDDRIRDGCFHLYAAYLTTCQGVIVAKHAVEGDLSYPDIGDLFPSATRMQRATHDLLGITAEARDQRGWLRHDGWGVNVFPLRRDAQQPPSAAAASAYPFVSVVGDGVHEIPVGPVHAGTIEPGHFRFSVVGEKVLRLEERLGYTHKGVAKRFEQLPQSEGHRLASRISGDSAVAFSWAYCAALESITEIRCPARAVALRALALELERIANHLGDLGALGNDAGLAFGLVQFSRLKEDLLRVQDAVLGARYLFDYIVPGGVGRDITASSQTLRLAKHCRILDQEVRHLRSIYDQHAGLQDRMRETGRLDRSLALELGAAGLAARASGIARDLRADYPWLPYTDLKPRITMHSAGDVAARVQVRFGEVLESLRLCNMLLQDVPAGPVRAPVPAARTGSLGLGLIEGWRGPVLVALESGPEGSIYRCHTHDPSWQNWPLLEYAIVGNIVPDFPLINKSFNLSYSGHDG